MPSIQVIYISWIKRKDRVYYRKRNLGVNEMIFLFVGSFLTLIGVVFRILPSKEINRIYGYRSPLAESSLETWRYAQKISSYYFIFFGLIMVLIGSILKYFGWTNFFIIEMFLLVFPIMPIFILTEKKLQLFEHERGKKNQRK